MPDGKLDNDPIFTIDTNALWTIYFFVILGTITLPGALMSDSVVVIIAWAAQLILQTALLLLVLTNRTRADKEAYRQVLALHREVIRLTEVLDGC